MAGAATVCASLTLRPMVGGSQAHSHIPHRPRLAGTPGPFIIWRLEPFLVWQPILDKMRAQLLLMIVAFMDGQGLITGVLFGLQPALLGALAGRWEALRRSTMQWAAERCAASRWDEPSARRAYHRIA